MDAIGYTDDKEKFADEFIKNIQLQSLSNLVQSLPVDKQDEVKQRLDNNSSNPEAFASILNGNFSQSEIQQSLQKSAQDMVSDYLQSINDSLSVEQRNNLAKVSEEFHQNTSRPT